MSRLNKKNIEIKEEKAIYLLPIKFEYKKELKSREKIDKISAVADPMFHALFNHPGRIMFPARLVSYILDIPFDTLVTNMKIVGNEVPMDKESNISQRCDCVCEIEGSLLTIEMNNNSSVDFLYRNMDYMFKQFSSKVVNSGNYDKYCQSILINMNNFSFETVEEVCTISYLKDELGRILTDRIIIINIYIPNLLKKCYNLGIESLSESEKFIYAVIEDDNSKINKLIKEMPMLEEYVNIAKEVSNSEDLRFIYDRDKVNKEQSFKEGKEEAIIEMIKKMYENGATLEIMAKRADYDLDEIKSILEID